MTDSKREHPDFADPPALAHDDKKAHVKPGRKFSNTEPKSKRTAQNRAAQRAYRERKEKKMKDLEDKVADLEDRNIKAATEQDLLKAQIDLLKRELARHRGHSDFSDLQLPTSVGKLTNPNPDRKENKPKASPGKSGSAEFPWAEQNLHSVPSGYSDSSNQHLPDLVSGSSSSTSPNENNFVSPDSQNSESLPASSIHMNLSPSNQFNISPRYEEQLDPFCVKLNEACGTKQKPVPKYRREGGNIPPVRDEDLPQPVTQDNDFQTLFTPAENINDPFFTDSSNYNFEFPSNDEQNDLLSFYNDNNFDVSLAFGNPTNELENRQDKSGLIDGLVTEESAYDPLGSVNTDFNFNEFVKSSLPSDASSRTNSVSGAHRSTSSVTSYNSNSPAIKEEAKDEEFVPASEKTIKCSEIWDRITSHPRYTELDIDGLCNELKSKAKCSEKGVVLDSKDVNKLIEKSVRT
ncbi:hypothetical protein FT663_02896 [Candidozyma haemuli var. vulneris]|uniref:BZIP domain-containing protein n=1 Tax=Candidozyma haemuli TaxID=45357 RepID=A0A2V1AVB7_9ASCO|nr:hypothetical protein CXQ85_000712 [[Candida] haemuloni]KAF3989215.1 hypothetical protein FT662_02958 [[Candida] haemuloni var. vulneris]KAF3991111.1 hypothetical protein FT663_02896 [[Candida] haemuloni var. vulneris]PVH21722.1 hypothetical protein CXQ85_000712 [[Candida] haemuloni]